MVERLLPDITETEARAVTDYMSELASGTLAAVPPLPQAELVWVKAALIRRWEAERQAQRPIDAMQSVHIGLGLVAAVVLLAWAAPTLLNSLTALQP